MTISSTRFNKSAQIDYLIVDGLSMICFNDFEYLLGISKHIIFIGDWRQCCPIGDYGLPFRDFFLINGSNVSELTHIFRTETKKISYMINNYINTRKIEYNEFLLFYHTDNDIDFYE